MPCRAGQPNSRGGGRVALADSAAGVQTKLAGWAAHCLLGQRQLISQQEQQEGARTDHQISAQQPATSVSSTIKQLVLYIFFLAQMVTSSGDLLQLLVLDKLWMTSLQPVVRELLLLHVQYRPQPPLFFSSYKLLQHYYLHYLQNDPFLIFKPQLPQRH